MSSDYQYRTIPNLVQGRVTRCGQNQALKSSWKINHGKVPALAERTPKKT